MAESRLFDKGVRDLFILSKHCIVPSRTLHMLLSHWLICEVWFLDILGRHTYRSLHSLLHKSDSVGLVSFKEEHVPLDIVLSGEKNIFSLPYTWHEPG